MDRLSRKGRHVLRRFPWRTSTKGHNDTRERRRPKARRNGDGARSQFTRPARLGLVASYSFTTGYGPLKTDAIIEEIDRIRDQAQAAFISRDVDHYMHMFSPDVVYMQNNGTALSYDRLAADVLKQLRVIPMIDISRSRDSYEVAGDKFIEVVTQHTSISAPLLYLLTRTVEMTRTGRYVWSNVPEGWKIVEVEILSDDAKSHWALGFLKPRRIS